jgi:hypothetical protein
MPLMPWKPVAVAVMAMSALAQTPAPDALARARAAYHAGKFDAAITAATEAQQVPALSNAAAVVLGRAHLERFRQSASPQDLEQARDALHRVVPAQLAPADYVEYLVGLGVALYFDGCTDGCFSAAAELFDRALARAEAGEARERVLEWWAGALDRQAQFGPEAERAPTYRRIRERADAELSRDDASAAAWYWLAAAARGAGELERAWGAAIAGWVRARSLGPRGEALRADLDRFVTQALLPERARQLSPDADPRPTLAQLVEQWEEIKKKYPDEGQR